MARNVLLVSEEKLKTWSELNDNIDTQLLVTNVQVSQEIGLQTLLGTTFYDHLLTAASGNTLTAAERTLLEDYIQPYLIQRAVYESLPHIYMRLMNKSVIIGNTEQGRAVDPKNLEYLRNVYSSRFQFYSQRLMDEIKNNQADFPLYFSWNSTDGMPPSKENYYSGIHISPGPRRIPPPHMRAYIDPSSDYCCKDY